MTTLVCIYPNGHNAEAVITDNGVATVQTLNPHSETRISAYDTKTVTVREIEGWSEDPRLKHPVTNEVPPARELTFGEKAVGLSFNPSGDQAVHDCKAIFAAAIDQMHQLRDRIGCEGEVRRAASEAITCAQTAQMWAVKALTWRG